MNYLKLIFSIVIIYFFSSCSVNQVDNEINYESIQLILKDSLGAKKEYKKILILEEKGCISCCRKYANLIDEIVNDSVLLIVTARGVMFDVDRFRSNESDNVIFDYKGYFSRNNILMNSGAIFMSDNKIDTIIEIKGAKNLNDKLNYIKEIVLR